LITQNTVAIGSPDPTFPHAHPGDPVVAGDVVLVGTDSIIALEPLAAPPLAS
jgi:hypothetical protein